MKWHRFNQDENAKELDFEIFHWTDVMPGDIVQSRGTSAFKQRDFVGRTEDTRVLRLHSSPVLVLSRHEGIPGEEEPGQCRTFVCLSRHGLIVVVQSVKDEERA